MSNCVNFNSPDVVKLAGELNVSPAVAAAKIGLYQDKNGLDKFPTVDELNNSKIGVNDVFKENEELFKIGTQQQYSQYLDTIFPDSKVKEIVYHSTKNKELNIVSKRIDTSSFWFGTKNNIKIGFYSSTNKEYSQSFITDIDEKTEKPILNGNTFSLLVNIKNPFYVNSIDNNGIQIVGLTEEQKEELDEYGYDGLLDLDEKYVTEDVVSFEPEQIHILGSKQDTEGFKKYVDELQQPNEVVNELEKEFDFTNIIDDSLKTIFPDTKSETITKSEDNQNHKLLFGDENIKTLSASKVLTNLISSDTFNNSKNEAFFLERLMNLLGKSGANLKLITDKNNIMYQSFNNDTVMLYDPITNTIYVTDSALENFDKETLAAAFMHEVVHTTTVQAYFNPKNAEEKMFKEFIDKAFNQYKHLSEKRDSKGNLMYGFTNQAEFIAEIYSNPEFRYEISNIEKNWLSKFIDEVRRIIGLIRNGSNNNLINSILLFETVNEFATADKSRWKGTLIKDPRYEKFGKSEFAKQAESKVKNLDDRLEKLLNIQKDNIAQVIRRAQSTNKKHSVKNQEFTNSVKELEKQLYIAAETDKLKGINIYVDFMVYQIDKIKGLIDKGNKTEKLEVIERYQNYLGATDLLKPITDALTDTDIKDLTEEQQLYSEEILSKIGKVGGYYNILQSQFTAYINKELIDKLNDPYYSEIVIQEFRSSLAKQYPKDSNLSKNEWINQEVIKRQSELDKLIEEDKNQLIKGVSPDIDGADKNIFSVLDTKSRFIQLAWKMITMMQSKINELIRNYDFKLDKLNSNLKNEKGKYDVKNLFEKDANGQTFVKGEYNLKFRDKYINEYSVLLDKTVVLNKKLISEGTPSTETHLNPELAKLHKELQKWRDTNFKFVKGVAYPADKYKNNLNFSKAEKAIHDEYLNLVHEGVKQFGKDSSLLRISLNANYYMIPYQTISNLERLKEGKLNIVDFAKQKATDLVDWKIDEVENTEKMFTPTGVEIHNVPVLYRNRLTKKEDEKEFNKRLAEQSVDLLTLMRLEFHNLTNHSEKTKNEGVLSAMVETAKNKDYTKIDGNGRKILNRLGINNKTVEIKGIDSNTYKRLKSIVDQTLYNQFNEAGIKILGKDLMKISKSMMSQTAFLGMTLNYVSAPVNILNAEFQSFILKVGGDIKKGALTAAHKFYFADMPNILNDVGRPVNHSVTNQLNEIFDIFGGLTSVQQDFVKNTMLKSVIDPQMLQILQTGGEHMVQSVLNISLMKSVKVLNVENKYIDKNGKIVTEEKAATLFDMINQDNKTKQVAFSDKFTYTSLSTNTKFNEGGFENIKLYIKKKISDTMGQHDKNYQSEYQKHWWGQLLSMYRKHVVPLGIARYRGAGKMFVNKLDLSEEDNHWNEFLQVNEEGYYTTFGRMFLGGFSKGLMNGLQNLKYSVLTQKWNEMSDYEKSNLKKATAEFAALALLNFVIIPLIAGLGANGDDDDDFLVYLLMESRKLEQELGSYTDPNDAYKITKSPTATLGLINNSINVGKFAVQPWTWGSTNSKDELRVLNALEKVLIPNQLRPSTTAKNTLKQMNQGITVPYDETLFYQLFNQDN